MSWELFRSIVDQIPNLARAVLHGVGEPMLVKHLPRMVRYLKDRGTYVLFNTNGTVLNEKNGRALIDADLDELRVSFDAANAESYRVIRGKNYFNRILKNVRAFRDLQEREGKLKPRVSAWPPACARRSSNCRSSCASPRQPASRKFICSAWYSSARTPSAWRDRIRRFTSSCRARRRHISIAPPPLPLRSASPSARRAAASEPGMSLKRSDGGSPWSMCRRPWTVMYITANGRALPCCIAPFSQRGYENYTLGDATQQTLREIWTGEAYRDFRRSLLSDKPTAACANCGLRWSL